MQPHYHKWTLEEKKRLASLLELYPLHAYQTIANRMGTKDVDEVKQFIEKMESTALQKTIARPRLTPLEKEPQQPPLEDWLTLCSGLVEAESFDTSSHLSKVMSIIAHFEDFPVPDNMPPVDYPSIYRFLSQILQWDRLDELDTLGALESSILLDMLHSLMYTLSAKDLTVQRTVMQWKCKLLDNTEEGLGGSQADRMRKVAENDYAEFIEKEEKKWSEKLMAASKQETEEAAENEKEEQDAAGESEYTIVQKKSSYASYKIHVDPEFDDVKRTDDPKMISMTTSAGKVCTYERSWRHKPGRKLKKAVPETPVTEIIVVKPPENVKIIKKAPRKKEARNERPDGKWSVPQRKDLEEIATTSSGIVDVSETTSKPANLDHIHDSPEDSAKDSVKVYKAKIKRKKKRDSDETFDVLLKRYEGYKRKYEQVQEGASKQSKKKPKLYTINPFCVPVSLLDLDCESL